MTVGLMKVMLDCAILRKCRTFRLYTIKWWIGKKVKFGENRQVNNGNVVATMFILSLMLFVSGIERLCWLVRKNGWLIVELMWWG